MTSPSPVAIRWVITGLGVVGIALLILSQTMDLTQKHVSDPNALEYGELLFEDDFERKDLGAKWKSLHKGWKIVDGWAHSSKAHNRALWLQQKFEGDIAIEFDVRSEAPAAGKKYRGDIKIDAFSTKPQRYQCGKDLCSHGYVVINGGWFNRVDLIARLDEHKTDPSIVKKRATRDANSEVKVSTVYKWRIVRRGKSVEWYRDGKLQLTFVDEKPLNGGFFGFNNWESNIYFDNLKVYALPR